MSFQHTKSFEMSYKVYSQKYDYKQSVGKTFDNINQNRVLTLGREIVIASKPLSYVD